MTTRSAGSALHGRQLVAALLTIFLVTAVAPPVAAWRLNLYRINQTRERALLAADAVRANGGRVLGGGIEVACGPGRLPKTSGTVEQEGWLSRAVLAPAVFGEGMPTDAWGQCFLMNVGAFARGDRVWVLSAGPNGSIDTPFGAAELAGDDIGAIIK